jgi:predicted amidohydrolase
MAGKQKAASKKRLVRIGLIKAVPKKWDLRGNWKIFEQLAESAVQKGAQIICTPECFLDGYVTTEKKGWSRERFCRISQSLTGKNYLWKAKEFAREHRVHVIFGFTERAKNGSYNAAAVISDSGGILGCYHKTHCNSHDLRYIPGDDFPVWNTALGKIGVLICADRCWPEAARTLRVRGAEIIMISTYGSWNLDNEWWMRTRAFENECVVCFAHPNVGFIVDGEGQLVAKLQSNVPDVLVHDVDIAANPNWRFKARRADIYEF